MNDRVDVRTMLGMSADEPDPTRLLSIAGLRVGVMSNGARTWPLRGVDLDLRAGETLALLGEAGCGKSLIASAITGLLDAGAQVEAGTLRLHGKDLLELSRSELRTYLGGRVATIFQDPLASLNPGMTVMQHLGEVFAQHRGLAGADARDEARRLLASTGLSSPGTCLDRKPGELAIGTCQSVAIALALAGRPQLLLADEPIGTLDPTVQTQVLALFERLRNVRAMAIMLFTRDPDVVRRMAQRVAVVLDGEVVEWGPSGEFLANPLHPYARSLIEAQPSRQQRGQVLGGTERGAPASDPSGCCFASRCPHAFGACSSTPPGLHVLGLQSVRCHLYRDPDDLDPPLPTAAPPRHRPRPPTTIRLEMRGLTVNLEPGRLSAGASAVDGVDLSLQAGRTLALLGESGSGKSRVGKAMAGLIGFDEGELSLDGSPLDTLFESAFVPTRRALQMIFQSPRAALNPFMRIGDSVAEGMIALGVETDPDKRTRHVGRLLSRVGLAPTLASRYPEDLDDFSLQCVAIARALAVSPQVLICDEPVAGFDAACRSHILNLLRELQDETGMSYLLITRNPGVAGYLADAVAVMYRGRIVEHGSIDAVLSNPAHPYTRAFVAASAEGARTPGHGGAAMVTGDPHTGAASMSGCHFHPRCPKATEICERKQPTQTRFGSASHIVRCHWPG
ncbi:MAG TPA: ABC transporter ATP-binding protein [Rhodocyclaceae bacterium]|nr:ABC transporter ATP-binding protein [Rhodocyclaceae bacterium]